MHETPVPDHTLATLPERPARHAHPGGEERGHTATFYFLDGSRLVVAVADAVAFSCGGGDGETRLVLLGPDRRVVMRGNLAALLRKHGLG